MPAGPAVGRVEAQRRALTTAEHGTSMRNAMMLGKIWMQERTFLPGKTDDSRKPIAVRFVGRIVPTNVDTKMCARAARSSCTSCASRHRTCGTTNDGVNDPVSTAWGHWQARTAGSFTPSLVQ